jgi:class 3 adenylate cyclase
MECQLADDSWTAALERAIVLLMAEQPTGTVTMLFADIEASTLRWSALGGSGTERRSICTVGY